MCYEFPDKCPEETVEKNPSFEEKLKQFKKENLLIISDFDYTITKRFLVKDGQKQQCLYSMGFYDYCPCLPESYRNGIENIKKEFSKYEFDLSYPLEIRDSSTKKICEDDMKMISDLHLGQNFVDETFKETSKVLPFYYRNGTKKFLELIEKNKIPIIIISAGVKDPITKTLQHMNPGAEKNSVVISNEFIYDDKNEKVIDYKKPVVYTFNKAEIITQRIKSLYTEEELKNKDILFLGDHMNDIDAIKNVSSHLKLSFAFDNLTNDKNEYLKKYDCVITSEGTFSAINDTLEKIINQ